jgi:hypothetical protein
MIVLIEDTSIMIIRSWENNNYLEEEEKCEELKLDSSDSSYSTQYIDSSVYTINHFSNIGFEASFIAQIAWN